MQVTAEDTSKMVAHRSLQTRNKKQRSRGTNDDPDSKHWFTSLKGAGKRGLECHCENETDSDSSASWEWVRRWGSEVREGSGSECGRQQRGEGTTELNSLAQWRGRGEGGRGLECGAENPMQC